MRTVSHRYLTDDRAVSLRYLTEFLPVSQTRSGLVPKSSWLRLTSLSNGRTPFGQSLSSLSFTRAPSFGQARTPNDSLRAEGPGGETQCNATKGAGGFRVALSIIPGRLPVRGGQPRSGRRPAPSTTQFRKGTLSEQATPSRNLPIRMDSHPHRFRPSRGNSAARQGD
jgi:hypothetical protein